MYDTYCIYMLVSWNLLMCFFPWPGFFDTYITTHHASFQLIKSSNHFSTKLVFLAFHLPNQLCAPEHQDWRSSLTSQDRLGEAPRTNNGRKVAGSIFHSAAALCLRTEFRLTDVLASRSEVSHPIPTMLVTTRVYHGVSCVTDWINVLQASGFIALIFSHPVGTISSIFESILI